MRLIDVDKLIESLNNSGIEFNANINKIIIEQPTAYDVDKVVEELRDCSFEVISEDCYVSLDLDEAIDIVKRGVSK